MSTHIPFVKYHGTGNDFVIIDQREINYIAYDQDDLIKRICQRHFGVGADGLMILANSDQADFEMVYFNADGRRSTMCGNGGRCIVHFAQSLGIVNQQTTFIAIDTLYRATITDGIVSLRMQDVESMEQDGSALVLDTGSPHYVQICDEKQHDDIKDFGASIRYSDAYKHQGINVNLLSVEDSEIRVSTYERGVEDVTLSCGTGVTAAALVAHRIAGQPAPISVHTMGGTLQVSFVESQGSYTDIWLSGPAQLVFKGEWIY